MSALYIGLITGLAAMIAVIIVQRRGARTAVDILPVLRDKGPLTIPELMTQLGVDGINARGKIVFAIDSLVRSGKISEGVVPKNIPQMKKIEFRKYSAL